MSGKRKRDYQAVYEEILKLLPTCSKLENIVLDFEAAQWQAIKTVLPEVHIQGCAFHFAQAVHRQIQTLGLSTAYRKKGAFTNFAKSISALPLLPFRLIKPAFAELREVASECEQAHTLLLTYVEATMATVFSLEPEKFERVQLLYARTTTMKGTIGS